jgi:transcriptional regulator with XRE-family HTH domain
VKKTITTEEHFRLCRALRARRHYVGLRQIDVCERLGVNSTFVSKYEKGERRLDLIELREVCEALDTTLIDFVVEFERTRPADG